MNRYYKLFTLIAPFLFAFSSFSFAQTLALWEFDGQNNVTTIPPNGTVSAAIWSTGTTTYTSGNTNAAADKAITMTGFNTPALSASKYLQFTISPNANFGLSLGSLSFYEQRSGTGPVNWVLRSSIDGYASDINVPSPSPTSEVFGTSPQSVELGIGFQNLATSVTFRLFAYGAISSVGTWRLDDLSVEGTLFSLSSTVVTASKPAIAFTTNTVGTPSVAKSFIVGGFGLTGNLIVTAPNGYEVSLTESSGYTNTLVLPQTNGTVASKIIYIRLTGATAGAFNGNLTLVSFGSPIKNVALSGNTIVQPTRANIATVRSNASGANVLTGGRVTVATEFGPNQIFIQDVTGGISVFSNIGTTNNIQLGDSVEILGIKSSFNGLNQINVLNITKINTASYNPPPLVIQQAEMAAHEGELVTIQNTQFPGTGGFYTANTNYAFGLLPIRILSTNTPSNDIVGTMVQSAMGHVTGISGVFGSNLQLYPRSMADFTILGSGITDANFQDNTTLDVATWNVNWYGHPTLGVTDKAAQVANVRTTLLTLNADIYQFDEVSDSVGFKTMTSILGGYTCRCSPEYSYSNVAPVDPYGQRVCFVYKNALFSNVTLMPLLTAEKNDTTLLTDYPNTRTRFWASGRLPYLMTANVTINGVSRFMGFVGIHARANTASNDAQEVYNMRKYDVEKLKTYLDANYPSLPFIMLGDFNDDLDETVSNVATQTSTYAAYIGDTAHYKLFTLPLSKAGAKSNTGFPNMIDHIIGSDEMSSAFLSARVASPQTYITSYSTKTSDHYPVLAKFNLANVPAVIIPVELLSFEATLLDNQNVELRWATASERNSDYFNIEKSSDGKSFSFVGKVKAAGQSNQKKVYSFTDTDGSDDKIVYYRLKQVDNDGSVQYSKVVSIVKNSKNALWKVYPNPVKNTLTIEGSDNLKTIRVYNAQGILVKTDHQKMLSIADFTAGIYVVEIENTEGVVSILKISKE